VMGVSMMILFPLTFASNIFVDPATMPQWLQAFVAVNPVTTTVTAVRGFMHATITASDVVLVLFTSSVFVVIFAPVTMYLYRRKR
jgi:ABC-2 type transport system permease protein